MARLDLNRQTEGAFIARIAQIKSEAQRQWGTMGPEKLLRHLTHTFRVSLGEDAVADKIFVPLPRIVLWYLFFEWFTRWPRGKIQGPPSFFPEELGDLEGARADCIDALQRFVARLESHPQQKGFSPLLGDIPLTRWCRVHGVHLDHHLVQYGVSADGPHATRD